MSWSCESQIDIMKKDVTELQLMSTWCHEVTSLGKGCLQTWKKTSHTDTCNLWLSVYFLTLTLWTVSSGLTSNSHLSPVNVVSTIFIVKLREILHEYKITWILNKREYSLSYHMTLKLVRKLSRPCYLGHAHADKCFYERNHNATHWLIRHGWTLNKSSVIRDLKFPF